MRYHQPYRSVMVRPWVGLIVLAAGWAGLGAQADAQEKYYAQPPVYHSRPSESRTMEFGHIGPTGVVLYINEGVTLTVEAVQPGSPAEGKFTKGDVILGVNGQRHQGHNPFVFFGEAITRAEATDGRLVFDVQSGEAVRQVELSIPVLGEYSKTWPLNCEKSKKIIEQAAAYYSGTGRPVDRENAEAGIEGSGVEGALACLFLLSTGDDKYLPVVRRYFEPMIANPKGIGDNTWNNGYNGIACAEYYLRSGDKSVLPVLQAYCDDARDRQKFGVGWTHWSRGINPGYVASGLMNPAGAQVLTTLLLGKECGVNVDDATLLGALEFFYRFVGHGTVPYGDHRGEGGVGSNGKDGMIAAAMQVAMGAKGSPAIYKAARDDLSMATLKSYPGLATGHADEGRGDGMWRGTAASYLKDIRPDEYRAMMDRLKWWVDLSRFHDGAMGIGTCTRFNDRGSGAGVMMMYTAPLKTLRITGAARSKFAVEFSLPEHLWGRPADLAFLSIDHHPKYLESGPEDEPHVIANRLGSAYSSPTAEGGADLRAFALKTIYHHRYMFRTEAAKALRKMGEVGTLQQLLSDPDPRLRRAALDGIIDWRYWFATGKDPLKTEQYTPEMIQTITKMLRDPDEAWYVVEGALWATRNMPAEVIQKNLDAIVPWTEHKEWWLRQAAFAALCGLEKDEAMFATILPRLNQVMSNEYRTQPREYMTGYMSGAMRRHASAHDVIVSGFLHAIEHGQILPGDRAPEGTFNILQSARSIIDASPGDSLRTAQLMVERLPLLDNRNLLLLIGVGEGDKGLYDTLDGLEEADRKALADLLHNVYLPELVRRLKADPGMDMGLIDTVLTLRKLKQEIAGWQVIGSPSPDQRVWRFTSVDPMKEEDQLPQREHKRFRDIALPEAMNGWFKPEFDDSKWSSGRAPIGKGQFGNEKSRIANQSAWGEGEFLLARTTFTIDKADHDLYRLRILSNQGWHIYLNGERISTYIWWNDNPVYATREMDKRQAGLLKPGVNTLAIYVNVDYPSAMNKRKTEPVVGQIDCYIEALRKSDLY